MSNNNRYDEELKASAVKMVVEIVIFKYCLIHQQLEWLEMPRAALDGDFTLDITKYLSTIWRAVF